MSTRTFPAIPMSFVPISTPSRTRIYLVSQEASVATVPRMSQVLTLNDSPEAAKRLTEALNTAAWTGDRSDLDRLLQALPGPIRQACDEALSNSPDPSQLALGFDDVPMTILSEMTFGEGGTDLAIYLRAAMDLGLQVLVENSIDERGYVRFDVTLLSGDREVEPGDVDSWWPTAGGVEVADRLHPNPADLDDALKDDRWATQEARAYWLWVIERNEHDDDPDSYSATAEWVVEFLDLPLDVPNNYQIFVEEGDPDDRDASFFTIRTRYLLWNSLCDICADLDSLTMEWPEWDSTVKEDMPLMVQAQPHEWWREMFKSAERLCSAARLGRWDDLVPRTPAEEALISLATRPEYIEAARDYIDMLDRSEQYGSLPVSEDDEVWGEILGELTGDVDIEMVWSAKSFAQTDPNDEVNRRLGMGDYRPEAWHRLFDRAVPRTLPPEL
ncbi:UNVERIFIED_CONTAM: hypothetical protein DES50_108199 [Williamsia faeni]